VHEISFFKKKNDPFAFAVTPDETGSVLPSPGEWKHWFSQPTYPGPRGESLARFEAGFRQEGYYIFPRNGSMQPDHASALADRA
jgi:hypothetical protein